MGHRSNVDHLEVLNVNRDELKKNGQQVGVPAGSAGFRRGLEEAHSAAAGELCADDGSGCCVACGVSLACCDACGGVGFHRGGCELLDGEDGEGGVLEGRRVPVRQGGAS